MVSSLQLRAFADELRRATSEQVELEWAGPFRVTRDRWDDAPIMQEVGLYMFLDGDLHGGRWSYKSILRIGLAYEQTLAQRISQYRNTNDLARMVDKATQEIVVKVARVNLPSGRRISKVLVRHVENLLLVHCAPRGNVQATDDYVGRDLVISNTGRHLPLPPEMSSFEIEAG